METKLLENKLQLTILISFLWKALRYLTPSPGSNIEYKLQEFLYLLFDTLYFIEFTYLFSNNIFIAALGRQLN